MSNDEIQYIRNDEDGQFQAINADGVIAGEVGFVDRSTYLDVYHTGVREIARGTGLAAKITKAFLEYMKANGLKVLPRCPYMSKFISENPQYQEIVMQ